MLRPLSVYIVIKKVYRNQTKEIINIRKNPYYSFLSILGDEFSPASVLLDPFE